ncbi:MAG: hypothetical protein NTZ67_09425 [Gammaproteobacteria bacterium]|nr:hypothetical protein [Gammaproteobacteria bacterium]
MRTIITTDTSLKDLHSILLSLDPLVGDNVCQLYSAHLLMLFLKVQGNSQLTEDEIKFLNACHILTFTADNVLDLNGCTLSRKANPELLSGEISSKTQREKKVKEARKCVATTTFDFFSALFNETDFFDEIMRKYTSSQSNLYISASHCQTPLLPFYVSCKIMFFILKQYRSLLIVNLKRLTEDKKVIAHYQLHYRYDETTKTFGNISTRDTHSRECAWLRKSGYCI